MILTGRVLGGSANHRELSVSTSEYFDQGQLDNAVKSARQEVKANPGEPALRFRLFELLLLNEDFAEAETELRQVQALDSTIGVAGLLMTLTAARQRHELLTTGDGRGGILGRNSPPPSYLEVFLDAIYAVCRKKPKDAEKAVKALLAEWSEVGWKKGAIDGERFTGIRDWDDFTGWFVEVFYGGDYNWVPFENVRRITFKEPETYVDAIWIPAEFDTDDGSFSCHVPALYAGTGAKSEELRLGLRTEPHKAVKNIVRLYGQREFMYLPVGSTVAAFKAIREVREIVFD